MVGRIFLLSLEIGQPRFYRLPSLFFLCYIAFNRESINGVLVVLFEQFVFFVQIAQRD
jgi:hypothetical protein